MINPNLNINKAFREQVDKCTKTAVDAITQTSIRATFSKKTRVLALLMFFETRSEAIDL